MYKSFNVKTLGILEITHLKKVFPEERKRSTQVELLIIYLILNRGKNITASQLIDYLWGDRETNVTIGALRNLVYRARRDLKQLYSKETCILSKGHTYFWNPAIKLDIDFEQVLDYCRQIIESDDLVTKYELTLKLADLYENDFLPEYQANSWILNQSIFMKQICHQALVDAVNKCQESKQYHLIIEIINHPNVSKIESDQLFSIKIDAYYHLKQYDQAIKYYQDIINHYYIYYGKEVPNNIEQIYQDCLNQKPDLVANNISLKEFMTSSNSLKGAFYCEFPVFKRIYQLHLVDIKKTSQEHALVMLTIKDKNDRYDSQIIQAKSLLLKNIMQQYLRKSDIFSNYSTTQYFILLSALKRSGIETAVNRICSFFDQQNNDDNIYLETKIETVVY